MADVKVTRTVGELKAEQAIARERWRTRQGGLASMERDVELYDEESDKLARHGELERAIPAAEAVESGSRGFPVRYRQRPTDEELDRQRAAVADAERELADVEAELHAAVAQGDPLRRTDTAWKVGRAGIIGGRHYGAGDGFPQSEVDKLTADKLRVLESVGVLVHRG